VFWPPHGCSPLVDHTSPCPADFFRGGVELLRCQCTPLCCGNSLPKQNHAKKAPRATPGTIGAISEKCETTAKRGAHNHLPAAGGPPRVAPRVRALKGSPPWGGDPPHISGGGHTSPSKKIRVRPVYQKTRAKKLSRQDPELALPCLCQCRDTINPLGENGNQAEKASQ